MLTLVCPMAYGDCLITLSQLEHVSDDAQRWRVVGTGVTRRVSDLLRKPLPVVELLADKAAFYTIKERGVPAALRELLIFRRRLVSLCRPGDHLAFERRDLRNVVLRPLRTRVSYAPRSSSVYADRRALVQSLFGALPDWPPQAMPARTVRRVLVNPSARYRHRNLSPAVMENLLRLCARREWELTLVDPTGEYAALAPRVAQYLTRTTLPDAAAQLRASDLYIGPDSFFVHLAYYFRVPHIGLFHPGNLYFRTPGMAVAGNMLSFAGAAHYGTLERGVFGFVDGCAAPDDVSRHAHTLEQGTGSS